MKRPSYDHRWLLRSNAGPVKQSSALNEARRFQQDLIEWGREVGENWALEHPDVNVPTAAARKKRLSPGPTFSALKPKNATWMRNLNTSMLNRKLPNLPTAAAPKRAASPGPTFSALKPKNATWMRNLNTSMLNRRLPNLPGNNAGWYNNKKVAARIAALQASLKRTATRPPLKIRPRSPVEVKNNAAASNTNFNKQMAALNAAMASLKSDTSSWQAATKSRSRPASPSATNARAAISLPSSNSNSNSNSSANANANANGNRFHNGRNAQPWLPSSARSRFLTRLDNRKPRAATRR